MKESIEKASGSGYAVLSQQSQSLSIPMFITRFTNRSRRFILPFWIAAAGAAIILSENLSTKKTTLNL